MLGSSGVMRWSSSASFGKKARYKFAKPGQKAPAKPAAKPTVVEKAIGGEKNGGTRKVQAKRMVSFFLSSYYCCGRSSFGTQVHFCRYFRRHCVMLLELILL